MCDNGYILENDECIPHCYSTCLRYNYFSSNKNEQKCKSCIYGYYLVDNINCEQIITIIPTSIRTTNSTTIPTIIPTTISSTIPTTFLIIIPTTIPNNYSNTFPTTILITMIATTIPTFYLYWPYIKTNLILLFKIFEKDNTYNL